ncbi:MAG: hypothetical protein OXF56_23405 [Rhodobacteraceae bacterium]|nr:hypothetical protein [Paracoccaceae bacterium]
MRLRISMLLLAATLSACSSGWQGGWFDDRSRSISLTEAQYCAVGHDLARQIADHVSVRGIILVSPVRGTPCERYALHYLRRAGFAIDTSAQSPTFRVQLEYAGPDSFQAMASIGRTLRISRIYVPGDGGVYPASPVSVMRLSARTVWRAPAELIRAEPR